MSSTPPFLYQCCLELVLRLAQHTMALEVGSVLPRVAKAWAMSPFVIDISMNVNCTLGDVSKVVYCH
jgi:hypothetical protein